MAAHFQGQHGNTADICQLSIYGRIPPAPAGQRSKEDSPKYLRTPGVGGSSELVRDYSSISRSLSGSVEVPRTPSVTVP